MLNETGANVVYWFGAGASANALPTVKLMPDALKYQAEKLRRAVGGDSEVKKEIADYEKELRRLAELSIAYGTLDTYARSLYLQPNRQKELASLKLHLSMFFVLEPLVVRPPPSVIVGQYEYRAAYDLDPRYMGWLAVLLSDGLRLNPRVKVISWNYDFQVELALARYCQAGATDQMHERFKIHPSAQDVEINGTDFFLTHLNGIAGQERRKSGIHPWYRGLSGIYPNWVTGLFKMYSDEGDGGETMRNGFVERLTFAWEEKEVATTAIELAVQALHIADVLVVVGYSFPPFNRLIDKQLLKAFEQGQGATAKRLIVQNPEASVDHFYHLFDLDKDCVQVEVDTDPNQFHLPSELFSE